MASNEKHHVMLPVHIYNKKQFDIVADMILPKDNWCENIL